MVAAQKQYHSLLFTLESPLPAEIPGAPAAPEANEARRRAQAKFAEYIKKEQRLAPMLVAKFIARQIAVETQKLVEASSIGKGGATPENDYTDSDAKLEKYVLADHLERLRYLEVVPNKDETTILADVLSSALPGLEEFITEQKYSTFIGKIAYNAFGVCYGGGRDDRVRGRIFSFT